MTMIEPEDLATIRTSQLFDAEWYLQQYPEVRMLGIDAAEHYLWLGARLKRNPSRDFDTAEYLVLHPDVAARGVNPLVHYCRYGRTEKRRLRQGNCADVHPLDSLFAAGQAPAWAGSPTLAALERLAHPRVLVFSHNLQGAEGAPRSLFELCVGLKSQQFSPVVLSPTEGNLRARYEDNAIPVIVAPGLASPFQGVAYDTARAEVLKSALQRFIHAFDIGHVVVNTAIGFHLVHAAKACGTPCVWIIRESEDPVDFFAERLPEQARAVFFDSLRSADRLVFVSDSTRRIWARSAGLDETRVHTIPNGLDAARFATFRNAGRAGIRAELGVGDHDIAIVNVGTVCERKNQVQLLDALLQLPPETIDTIKVFFIGELARDDYARDFIERIASDERLRGRVAHVPSTPDIGKYYRMADVFVLTSLVESYPRVVLEALEFGLPVIANPVYGVTEQTEDGVSAVYYDAASTATLSERLVQLLDPGTRERLSRGALDQSRRLLDYGAMVTCYGDVLRSLVKTRERDPYTAWIETVEAPSRRQAIARAESWTAAPLAISIVVPVYKPELCFLEDMAASVFGQAYPHWQLCIADDASGDEAVAAYLRKLAASDPRVKVTFRSANGHISECLNSALALATCPYFIQLDQDDLLADTAVLRVVETVRDNPDLDLVFSDEDKIDAEGRRHAPYFKSGFNRELLYTHNYMVHLAAYRTSVARSLGGYRTAYDGAQDLDLNLRVVEATERHRIHHIPEMLYHWRAIPGSTALAASEKPYQGDSGRAAVHDHLARCGIQAEISKAYKPNYRRIVYPLPDALPAVDIVIPTRDHVPLLRRLVDSVLERTDYANFKVTIVDNMSREPETAAYFDEIARNPRVSVMPYRQPFNFSAICNAAAAASSADVLCFLNNDMEVIEAGWLATLVRHALLRDVGAVGAKLYYPDDTVQHCGIVVGIGNVARSLYHHLPRRHDGYAGRAMLPQEITAVTGACLVTRREVFADLGGFDENLGNNYNDLDLCLRAWQADYRVLLVPDVELYHYEGKTRAAPDSGITKQQITAEEAYMRARWGDRLHYDPFTNPNLVYVADDETKAAAVFALRGDPKTAGLRTGA